jgi:GNAT superfamily N-acetyltransferase
MLTYRMAEPGDAEGCLSLLQQGHDPRFTAERFAWLHRQSPLGPSRRAVCVDGDRIVGLYSVIPRTIRLDDRRLVGGRDVDPVVHADLRGQGVFDQLLQFGLEHFHGIDFLYNFANPASARGFLRNGWRLSDPLEDRVCQLGYGRLLSREGLIWLASFARAGRRTSSSAVEIDGERVDAFLKNAEFDQRLFAPSGRLWAERNAAVLRWRYLEHPLHAYRWFLSDDGAALAVVRHDTSTNRLTVLDLVGLDREPQLTPFLPLWATLFPAASVNVWSSMPEAMRPHFIGNPLRRGQGLPFLTRPMPGAPAVSRLDETAAWFIAAGDVEVT